MPVSTEAELMQFNLSENYNLSEPQLEVFGFGFAIEFIEFSAGGERLYLGFRR